MLKKYREYRKRKQILTFVKDFERCTRRFKPTTLGNWGVTLHLVILLTFVGVALYLSSISDLSFFEVFFFATFWIYYFSICGGALMLALVLFAIGIIPFLFSSVAHKRLTNENDTLKNFNTAFVRFDKTIFFGLLIFQAAMPIVAFSVHIFNNQG